MAGTVTNFIARPFAAWSPAKRQMWATILLAAVFAIYPLLTDDDSNVDAVANREAMAAMSRAPSRPT